MSKICLTFFCLYDMIEKIKNGVIKMPRKKPELNKREKAILKFIEK